MTSNEFIAKEINKIWIKKILSWLERLEQIYLYPNMYRLDFPKLLEEMKKEITQ